VTLVARSEGRLRETAAGLDGPVHLAPCDIRKRSAVDRAFARAAGALGPIHALVAVSGIGGPNGEDDEGGDRFDDIVATNLNGTYYCTRSATSHPGRTRGTWSCSRPSSRESPSLGTRATAPRRRA